MRKRTYLSILTGFLLMFAYKSSQAQVAAGDSSSQQNAFNNAVSYFRASFGDEAPIYNGPEYYFYDPTIKGNAYFMDVNSFSPGSVVYDGAEFSGAPMLYDLYSDKVVVLLFNHFSKFSLIKEKVKSFDFLDHHFVNIDADTIQNNKGDLKSGYYDELYNGRSEVLVRRSKTIQTSTGGTLTNETFFTPARDFYLKRGNTYYSVSGEGSLVDALKDKKKQIQQYIKASQIKFRKDPEEAMVKIVNYYDHLTN